MPSQRVDEKQGNASGSGYVRSMRPPTTPLTAVAALILGMSMPSFAADRAIVSVSVSPEFFNPSLKQTVSLSIEVESEGSLAGYVLDRDGYVVRKLPDTSLSGPGRVSVEWDGRNDDGEIVPDEAYSFKLDFNGRTGSQTWFPASSTGAFSSLKVEAYDRQGGSLRYTLPKASRVHIQAGSAKVDAQSGRTAGPVLKTIVNRAPRIAGSIVESWPGFDESGTIYVPELPDFVVAIAATSLPENSVITVGNRRESFGESLVRRKGTSLLPPMETSHHHGGLTTLDDTAPSLGADPLDATWSESEKAWITKDSAIQLEVRLEGFSAERFSRQPGRVMVFVGQEKVLEVPAHAALEHLDFRVPASGQPHAVVAVNWVSDHGPVAVTSFRIRSTAGLRESSGAQR